MLLCCVRMQVTSQRGFILMGWHVHGVNATSYLLWGLQQIYYFLHFDCMSKLTDPKWITSAYIFHTWTSFEPHWIGFLFISPEHAFCHMNAFFSSFFMQLTILSKYWRPSVRLKVWSGWQITSTQVWIDCQIANMGIHCQLRGKFSFESRASYLNKFVFLQKRVFPFTLLILSSLSHSCFSKYILDNSM